MKNEFVIWEYKTVRHASGLEMLPDCGFDDEAGDLLNGGPLAARFPSDVRLTMNADTPNDTVLPDNVSNIRMLVLVSPRLANFLRQRNLPAVEYLPVTVIDHKGTLLAEPFSIVHPIEPLDCVDESASVFERSRILGRYRKFDRLVLDPARIPAERALFRIAKFWSATLVRRSLAEELLAAGFTGLAFAELPGHH